jgi:adenosylcobinamide kinase/adenosylcobinamide-phosphate guanylyltransferase
VITLVLGGARSGKSEVAERLLPSLVAADAAAGGSVTYIATGAATDPDMAARIAAHQARRPASWDTVEAGADLAGVLRATAGPVLVDSLGTWVAAAPDFVVDRAAVRAALTERRGDTVLVSDEVGLGVHPATEVGRRFRDALGEVNQEIAAVADDVLLVVAGRVLRLEAMVP